MKKIKTEVTFGKDSYGLVRKVNETRLFFNALTDECLVVDKDDNVLFRIFAYNSNGISYIKDITE